MPAVLASTQVFCAIGAPPTLIAHTCAVQVAVAVAVATTVHAGTDLTLTLHPIEALLAHTLTGAILAVAIAAADGAVGIWHTAVCSTSKQANKKGSSSRQGTAGVGDCTDIAACGNVEMSPGRPQVQGKVHGAISQQALVGAYDAES